MPISCAAANEVAFFLGWIVPLRGKKHVFFGEKHGTVIAFVYW
jgi:hypothetical protein